jgi:hypothetical protein
MCPNLKQSGSANVRFPYSASETTLPGIGHAYHMSALCQAAQARFPLAVQAFSIKAVTTVVTCQWLGVPLWPGPTYLQKDLAPGPKAQGSQHQPSTRKNIQNQ